MHDSYAIHMHAIGVSERVTLLEFEQGLPEVQVLKEGDNEEEVLECPDH